MTNEEAIRKLKQLYRIQIEYNVDDHFWVEATEEVKSALDMAINALENADKYRWHDVSELPLDMDSEEFVLVLCAFSKGNYPNGWYEVVRFSPVLGGYVSRFTEYLKAWRYIEPYEVEE